LKLSIDLIDLLVVCCLLLLAFGRFEGCALPAIGQKATAATYTLDDKQHSVPPPVSAALNKLNRQGILATVDEVDTTDGSSDVPDQYKVSRPAAIAAGLPALVVMSGEKVLRTVKDPRTEEAVMEAVK
jgi:hypothetical protein